MMEAQQKVIAAFDKGLNAKRIILGQNAVAKIAKAVPQSAQPVRHERNRKRMQSVRAINAESIGGQADRIARAVQQLRPEPQVQRPDAAAESGLCDVVRLGRARKVTRRGDAEEFLKPCQFHGARLNSAVWVFSPDNDPRLAGICPTDQPS